MKFPAILLFIVSLAARASAADGGYLFVTFRGESTPLTEQIYFLLSQDGRRWAPLNNSHPVLISQVGEKGVRDPYILRSHDGRETFLLATDLSIHLNPNWGRSVRAGSRSIVVWDSTDLVHWSPPRLVPVAAPDAGCTWAPEAVYDEDAGDYLVFWASTNGNDGFAKHRIWACRTKDFVTFGPAFIYIDKPYSVIDADIVRDHGTYYRFSKDERDKAIDMEASQKLLGPWSDVSQFSLASLRGYEGPECFPLERDFFGDTSAWCLMLDQYSRGAGYWPFVTHDLSQGQFTAASGFSFPFLVRHGAVLPVNAAEMERLKSATWKP